MFKLKKAPPETARTPEPAFEYSISANEYGFICIPDEYRHRQIVKTLIGGGVYEPATLRFIRRQLGEGDIVSGGAFIGDFFPAICESLAPGARLHSFEPNPMNFEAAQKTIELNRLDNIEFHPVAVGEKHENLVLQVARAGGSKIAAGERIVADMSPDDERGIEVDVVTLDNLIPQNRNVSVLHLDVEGFEVAAFKGASRILNESRPLVLAEGDKPWKLRNFTSVLNDLVSGAPYQLVGNIEKNAIFRAF